MADEARYPAVKLNGNVYVATRSAEDPTTQRRMPVRHVDALTKAIYVVAGCNDIEGWKAQQLIKSIDMGRVTCEYGSALADGTGFVAIAP